MAKVQKKHVVRSTELNSKPVEKNQISKTRSQCSVPQHRAAQARHGQAQKTLRSARFFQPFSMRNQSAKPEYGARFEPPAAASICHSVGANAHDIVASLLSATLCET
jgi:hypothetical protein